MSRQVALNICKAGSTALYLHQIFNNALTYRHYILPHHLATGHFSSVRIPSANKPSSYLSV